MIGRRRRLEYVPLGELRGRPHVMVDGAPRPGTVLTLSHWPGTPTPPELWADLSAEIVLRALARRSAIPSAVRAATVDHYDADGILALGLLVLPGVASRWAELAVAAARVGDFDVVTGREPAQVAFALDALGSGSLEESVRTALDWLPALLERPGDHEVLWGPQWSAYQAAEQLFDSGAATIEEHPREDLAVVRVEPGAQDAGAASWGGAVVHPGAVHARTSRMRVATVAGRHYELRMRYETWVRLVSSRPARRVDLSAVAETLSALEGSPGAWVFDGAGAITPALHRADDAASGLEPGQFVETCRVALAELDLGPPAWDPFAAPRR